MSQYIKVRIKNEKEAKIAAAILEAAGISNPEGGKVVSYIKDKLRVFGGRWDVLLIGAAVALDACSDKVSYYTDPCTDLAGLAKWASEREDEIKVGAHVATFVEKEGKPGVQVGCTFVEAETVKAIYERLFPAK